MCIFARSVYCHVCLFTRSVLGCPIMAAEESGSKDLTVKAKVVLQQCLSAKLMVKPDVGDQPAEYVEVRQPSSGIICV